MTVIDVTSEETGLNLLGADRDRLGAHGYGVLGDLLRDATRALEEAKRRAGVVPAMFGRFQDAEEEISQLSKAPDQADSRKRAALLIAALDAVEREPLPRWLAIPAVGAGGAVLTAGVVGHLTRTLPPLHPAVAVAQGAAKAGPLLGGLVALGGVGIFVAQQLLKAKPSSKTWTLQQDVRASRAKAEEELARTVREQDERDTATIVKQTSEDLQRRSAQRALATTTTTIHRAPSWFPKAGSADPRGVFGYYKDGKLVEVPRNSPVELDGRKGHYSDKGDFVPYAT